MLRNLIALLAGAVLSFVLDDAGRRLAWLIVGGYQAPNAYVRYMRVSYALLPIMFIGVGAFVALIIPRSRWWLSGFALLPLFIYGLIRGFIQDASWIRGAFVLLAVGMAVYIGLALLGAFVVSRFKRTRPV